MHEKDIHTYSVFITSLDCKNDEYAFIHSFFGERWWYLSEIFFAGSEEKLTIGWKDIYFV